MAELLMDGGLTWGRADGSIVSRKAFVAEAREWLNTPFQHQHEVKGRGVDCGGLIRGASVVLGLIPPNYRHLMPAEVRGYARQPDGDTAEKLCSFYWRRIAVDSMRFGDVALIAYDKYPQHAAILGDDGAGRLTMIHALGPGHPKKVVEHRIDQDWQRRIVAAYEIPGVGDV